MNLYGDMPLYLVGRDSEVVQNLVSVSCCIGIDDEVADLVVATGSTYCIHETLGISVQTLIAASILWRIPGVVSIGDYTGKTASKTIGIEPKKRLFAQCLLPFASKTPLKITKNT